MRMWERLIVAAIEGREADVNVVPMISRASEATQAAVQRAQGAVWWANRALAISWPPVSFDH